MDPTIVRSSLSCCHFLKLCPNTLTIFPLQVPTIIIFISFDVRPIVPPLQDSDQGTVIQSVQLKIGSYFNITNLFTKTYVLYYTTKLYLL